MKRSTWVRRTSVLVAAVAVALPFVGVPTLAVPGGQSGIVCTTGPTFELTATDGTVSVPDGNTIYMWSYAPTGGEFQLPGPTLCVDQGDLVTIALSNTLPEPVSILFPGQTGVEASVDGGTTFATAAPEFDGGVLTSLTTSTATSGSVIYRFTASEPGTYIYESGTDIAKQVQMGLYGALVVRPVIATAEHSYAYDETTEFNPDAEFVMLFSEVDPDLHQAIERGEAYDITAYHPRYWMINGRSFPDTIAPNGAVWLPSQPYSSLVHVNPKTEDNPLTALIRYLNVGSLNHPFHPHGNHGRVIARDGRQLEGDGGEDLSYEKFTVLVGAGQTWDSTFVWTDVEAFSPSNPIPVVVPQLQNLQFKDDATWYSGSPYLGYQDELPTGVVSFNQCGEYYHVAHSHALQEAANFDAGFGGMLTLIRIDPPGGESADGVPCS